MQFRSVGTVMHVLNGTETAPLGDLLQVQSPRPTRAVMVEQRGACEHALGEVLTFSLPWESPATPVCPGLLRALRPFLTAAAIGLPPGQDGAYLLSCPGRQGTVWKVEATE